MPKTRVNWASVALYYSIACAWSWPFFWWRDRHPSSWAAWAVPEILKGWIPGFGPTLGALVALGVFRRSHPRTATLLGSSTTRSLAFAGVPLLGLTVAGLLESPPNLSGLTFGLGLIVYGLGEEIGWRGFLEGALAPLSPARRYILLGALWGTWHFTTFWGATPASTARTLAIMYPIWILASGGLGRAMAVTRSILVATMLHLVFNIFLMLPRGVSLPVLGISIVAWVALIRTWPSPSGEGDRGGKPGPEEASRIGPPGSPPT